MHRILSWREDVARLRCRRDARGSTFTLYITHEDAIRNGVFERLFGSMPRSNPPWTRDPGESSQNESDQQSR